MTEAVDFRRITRLVASQELGLQLSKAVLEFIREQPEPGTDEAGRFRITIQAMQDALDEQGELWVGTLVGELVIYILAGITNEVDGHPTYWVSQAWVREDQRGQPWVRGVWQRIRARAKELKCVHMVAVTGHDNVAAFSRFLGDRWHTFGTLLKEDLNG